jgi:hypothetical protein
MVFVLRSFVTGPLESYAVEFAEELARRGYTVNGAAQRGAVAGRVAQPPDVWGHEAGPDRAEPVARSTRRRTGRSRSPAPRACASR